MWDAPDERLASPATAGEGWGGVAPTSARNCHPEATAPSWRAASLRPMRYAIVTETYPPEINGVALTVRRAGAGPARARPCDRSRASAPGPRDAATPLDDTLLVRGVPAAALSRVAFRLRRALRSLARHWGAQRAGRRLRRHRRPARLVGACASARRLGDSRRNRLPHALRRLHARLRRRRSSHPIALRWMRRFHNARRRHARADARAAGRSWQRKASPIRCACARAVDGALFHPAQARSRTCAATWGAGRRRRSSRSTSAASPRKRISTLAVRAFRALQRDATRTHASCWSATARCARSSRSDNPDFVFCGLQRGEALARHFASGDLFLFPSHSETFGNVTLEAMASGVPTIAFDYGAAREYLRDGEHGARVPRRRRCRLHRRRRAHRPTTTSLRAAMRVAARGGVERLRPEQVARRFRRRCCADCSRGTEAGCIRGHRVMRQRRTDRRRAEWCLRGQPTGARTRRAPVLRRGQPARRRRRLVRADGGADRVRRHATACRLRAPGGHRRDRAGACTSCSSAGPSARARSPPMRASMRGSRRWTSSAFPSGHTLHAVAFTLVALAHYPVLAWLLMPFTASVAVSRVVLGLHYPSDVLAATAIGSGARRRCRCGWCRACRCSPEAPTQPWPRGIATACPQP